MKEQLKLNVELIEQFNDDEMLVLTGGGKLKEILKKGWEFLKDLVDSINGACAEENGENCVCNQNC